MLPTVDNGFGSESRGGTVYGRASSNTSSELCYAYIVATQFIVNPYWSYPPCDKNKTRAPVNLVPAGFTDVDVLFHQIIVEGGIKESLSGTIREISLTFTWNGRERLLRIGDVLHLPGEQARVSITGHRARLKDTTYP